MLVEYGRAWLGAFSGTITNEMRLTFLRSQNPVSA